MADYKNNASPAALTPHLSTKSLSSDESPPSTRITITPITDDVGSEDVATRPYEERELRCIDNENNKTLYQVVPRTVYRRVALGEGAVLVRKGKPNGTALRLGAFTTGSTCDFEVCHGEQDLNLNASFVGKCKGRSGISTSAEHPAPTNEQLILEMTDPVKFAKRKKEKQKRERQEEKEKKERGEKVEREQKNDQESVIWYSIGLGKDSVLKEMGEDDVYGGIELNNPNGKWKAHDGKGVAKYAFCYELPVGTTLPTDLGIVYDDKPPGHATITFVDGEGTLRYDTLNGQPVGIHDELADLSAWKLHCFLITAKAEVNETVYPDPGVLQLLQYVDKYMDVCDEEDFSSLMHALKKTQIVDEKEKTLEAIFVHSSHAPLFLRAINNIKDSLPEDEQDIVNELLRLVEV
jgi:hypothetical protein